MDEKVSGHILCSNWISTRMTEDEIVMLLGLEKQEALSFEQGLEKTHVNERMEYPEHLLISPKINSWRLIMGSYLMEPETSRQILEKLGQREDRIFSFGVDIWSDYHFWMMAEGGEVKRYLLYVDGQIEEEGAPLEFENELPIRNYSSVFSMSRKYGLNMDHIDASNLLEMSGLYKFREAT